MQLKKFVLLFFLLTAQYLFCQKSYPAKVVIDQDTLCALTIDQLDTINVSLVRLDECEILRDTLKKVVALQDQTIKHMGERNAEQNRIMEYQSRIEGELTAQVNILNEADRKNKKRIRWLKFQRNALSVGIAILGGFIILHH